MPCALRAFAGWMLSRTTASEGRKMSVLDLALLAIVFFATSIVSVVTGATSLVTVPVMLSFGIDARTALATNMLALTFLSAGAASTFWQSREIHPADLRWPLVLTVVGSVAGALLVFAMPVDAIRTVVAVAMLALAGLVLRPPSRSVAKRLTPRPSSILGNVVTFVLAIYGGFFSGGYVTLLTVAWTKLFCMPFRQAVMGTKFANLLSSLAAVVIFSTQGVIDWQLGAVLSVAAFAGALLGAKWTLHMSEKWLRRVFAATVSVLAVKMLMVDVQWNALLGRLLLRCSPCLDGLQET